MESNSNSTLSRLIILETKIETIMKESDKYHKAIEILNTNMYNISTKLEVLISKLNTQESYWEKLLKNIIPIVFCVTAGLWTYHTYTTDKIDNIIMKEQINSIGK